MNKRDMGVYLSRYVRAMNRITIPRLMELPEQLKKSLRETTDVVKKVKLLEEIADLYKL